MTEAFPGHTHLLFKPPLPVASAVGCSKAVVLLLFAHCLPLLLYVRSLFCFAVRCVSFLVLQSPRWGRKSWLLNFCSVLNVMSLLTSFDSSTRSHSLVFSM